MHEEARSWCRSRGGHLFTRHPLWGATDVYASTTPGLKFELGLGRHGLAEGLGDREIKGRCHVATYTDKGSLNYSEARPEPA